MEKAVLQKVQQLLQYITPENIRVESILPFSDTTKGTLPDRLNSRKNRKQKEGNGPVRYRHRGDRTELWEYSFLSQCI